MKIPVVVTPLDAFGNAGTGAGALLLADVLREAVDDAAHEGGKTRQSNFAEFLHFFESGFDTPALIATWRTDAGRIARDECLPADFSLWLGGNHLSVLPLLESLSPTDLVIQLDAHLDCYDLAGNTEELNHGNFLKELKAKTRPKIAHVGHRDLFLPAKRVAKHVDTVFSIDRVVSGFGEWSVELAMMIAKSERVWLDLDTDALDPAFAPAVHDQSPFGMTPQQLLGVLLQIPPAKFAGLSISEYDPGRDDGDRTLNLLGWFLERALLHRVES